MILMDSEESRSGAVGNLGEREVAAVWAMGSRLLKELMTWN
jgi:hypothetical protein